MTALWASLHVHTPSTCPSPPPRRTGSGGRCPDKFPYGGFRGRNTALRLLIKGGIFFLTGIGLLAILHCGLNQQATGPDNDGSATEVIAGNLVNEDGSPAISASVYLRPADYLLEVSAKILARASFRTATITSSDSLGNFAFDSIAPGVYTLECLLPEVEKGVLIDSVVITNPDSTTELPTDTLKPLGSISGQIQIPDSANLSNIRVLVYGLDRISVPDSMGRFSIPGLPEGNYEFRVVLPDTFVDMRGDNAAQVTPGDTTDIPASFLLYPSVAGKAYYIAPTGYDSAGGSESNPFRTIQRGVDAARAGDTVFVMNGTYSDPIVLQHSGQPNAPIVFRNYPGHLPVIRFSDSTGVTSRIAFISMNGSNRPIGWINVEGFEVTHGWAGFHLYNAHDVVIRNNHIHDVERCGATGYATRLVFDRNIVDRVGRFAECGADPTICNQDAGIGFSGTYIRITNNVVHSNLAHGICLTGYPYDPLTHAGPEYSIAKYCVVANNSIAFNQNRAGILVYQPNATHDVFENNILYENSQAGTLGSPQGIDFYDCGGNHLVRNNLFYATVPGGAVPLGDTRPSGSSFVEYGNLFDVDPVFADAAAYDFRLQSSSPAIDKGLDLRSLGVTTDFAGTVRPKGAAYDMGAYEN